MSSLLYPGTSPRDLCLSRGFSTDTQVNLILLPFAWPACIPARLHPSMDCNLQNKLSFRHSVKQNNAMRYIIILVLIMLKIVFIVTIL